MTKPTVTDAMVEAAIEAWFRVVKGAESNFLNGTPNPPVPPENLHDAMRAAITAAIEASGVLEENARLRDAILDIKQNWDWWDEDRYDRCSSVVGDAIADAMKEPTP